eukprot:SAG31_NODE_13381_length_873_cov_1.638243_1_plen_192_part_10
MRVRHAVPLYVVCSHVVRLGLQRAGCRNGMHEQAEEHLLPLVDGEPHGRQRRRLRCSWTEETSRALVSVPLPWVQAGLFFNGLAYSCQDAYYTFFCSFGGSDPNCLPANAPVVAAIHGLGFSDWLSLILPVWLRNIFTYVLWLEMSACSPSLLELRWRSTQHVSQSGGIHAYVRWLPAVGLGPLCFYFCAIM